VFASVGRRLALLNAVVVVAIIAVVGAVTFALLRQSLDREADRALAERAAIASAAWAEVFENGQPLSDADQIEQRRGDGEDDEREDNGEEEDEGPGHELLESGDVLLFGVDGEGRVLANARGTAVTGLPVAASIELALAGAVDARSVAIDGETVRVYSAPVRHDGRILGAVQAARSDREHQAELRLIGLMTLTGIGLGALVAIPAGLFLARRAMRPIDLAFSRQRAFVADASHELRTPLTLIRATTELVQRLPETDAAVRDELSAILAEVDATDRLVDDLLLLARLDSAELPLATAPVDLGETVRVAAQPFVPLAAAGGVVLAVDAAAGVTVAADAGRIKQIVRILLDNAIAYTPAEGSVRVAVERRGARGVVSVSDTGSGIAAADHTAVFERFYRADRARSRKTGGTGLGLAIAKALVLAQHGEIGLESQPGRGTTVWFSLLLSPAGRGEATG
jgi:signal transduction histidine kinase